MAEVSAVAATTNDDDEKYLYGDASGSAAKKDAGANGHLQNGEVKKEKEDDDEDGEFDESDDDDDDNIQVHIGEVNTSATGAYGTPVSWKKDAVAAAKSAILPTQGQKKIDVNTVGLINGQPIYEYDIDTEQDEKPWRKPGADISDYFNYGFTEDTWKQYCEKQRRMRGESNRGPYTVTQGMVTNPIVLGNQVEIEVLPDGRTRVKAGPPPDRKVEGSIHVLGSDADARRKQKEDELLALALGQPRVIAAPNFPGQRPLYTAIPAGGTVMYNQLGQQMIQPPTSSQGETTASENSLVSSQQGQQIQSIGAPTMMNSVLPPGVQYLPPGTQPIQGLQPMGGPQIFPPPHNMGMEFPPQDPFLHPGMPPGFGGPFVHSDDEFDSDGENRRHRSRRDQSRHRRHRERGDRESRADRDRDRDRSSSRRDRDRSESRSRRDHSKSSSERKKHSSRSASNIKVEEDDNGVVVERKSRSSSRRPTKQPKEVVQENPAVIEMIAEIKQEPVGD